MQNDNKIQQEFKAKRQYLLLGVRGNQLKAKLKGESRASF